MVKERHFSLRRRSVLLASLFFVTVNACTPTLRVTEEAATSTPHPGRVDHGIDDTQAGNVARPGVERNEQEGNTTNQESAETHGESETRNDLIPPRTGVYVYTGSRAQGQESSRLETSVEILPEEALRKGHWRQSSIRRQRNKDSNRETVQNIWNSRGIFLEEQVFMVRGAEIPCHYARPIQTLLFPLEVGATWKSDGQCGEGAYRSDASLSAQVLRTEMFEDSGAAYETYVILARWEIQTPTVAFTSTDTYWFSPLFRLDLKLARKTTSAAKPGSETQTDLTIETDNLRT